MRPGLQMRVVGYDPFVSKERFRELGVERAESQEDVLAEADFLTLHLPLTPETQGSIDAGAFARMKPGVRIVNAARGELVDEDALLDALRSGHVAGAALDVFSAEPYSGPLLELDNVVVTPHLAASTEEAQDRAGVIVAQQVAAALEGELVSNAVNIPAIRAEDMELLGPYIPLAATLGRLAMEIAGGRAERISLTYYGGLSVYDTRLLTVAALNGAFQGRVDRPVNYVNAPLVAEELGVDVSEEKRRSSRDFTNLIRVSVLNERGRGRASPGPPSGASTGAGSCPRSASRSTSSSRRSWSSSATTTCPASSAGSARSSARPGSTSRTWPSRARVAAARR